MNKQIQNVATSFVLVRRLIEISYRNPRVNSELTVCPWFVRFYARQGIRQGPGGLELPILTPVIT